MSEDSDWEAQPFDKPEQRVPYINFDYLDDFDGVRNIATSQMFLISGGLDRYLERNPNDVVYNLSQGDGGMSLPGISKQELIESLSGFLPDHHCTKYSKHPHGDARLRDALYRNYYGFTGEPGQPTLDQVIITCGGREALYRWATCIVPSIGEYVVTTAAPWPSYGQLFYQARRNVLMAPGKEEQSFCLTEEGINACAHKARSDGRPIAAMVLTSPGNPTGHYHTEEELRNLIEHAVKCGIPHVLLDLIYQMVIDDDAPRYNLPRLLASLSDKARLAVTAMDGTAKVIGGSNLRDAHLVVCNPELAHTMRAVPSHVTMPAPLGEAVALSFYGSPDPWQHPWRLRVTVPTNKSRNLAIRMLRERGFRFISGQGYYVFVNVADWIDANIMDVKDLSLYLSESCGVAIVPGGDFRQPHWVRISVAVEPDYIERGLNRFFAGLDSLK